MATLGYFDKQFYDTGNLFFKLANSKVPGFKVKDFSNGIIEIAPLPDSSIEDFLDVVMGCFETCSNFHQEILKVYNCPTNTVFKGIHFTHEGVTLYITVSTLDKYKILAEYWKNRYYSVANC